MATMADIKTKPRTLDLRSNATKLTEPGSQSVAATSASDAKIPTTSSFSTRTIRPASQMHGMKPSGSGVLDLRSPGDTDPDLQSEPVPAPKPPELIKPTEFGQPTPEETPPRPAGASLEHVATTTPPVPVVPVPPKPKPAVIPTPPNVSPAPQPIASPVPPSPAISSPPAVASSRSALIQKFPAHPAVAAAEPSGKLPNHVATQIDSMKTAVDHLPPEPTATPKPALKEAITAAKKSHTMPKVIKIAAALAAIAIMGGLIWMQNSPKLAFHNAASKVGIDASLPTYVPSSYRQNGPVGVGNGQLTLSFTSPSSDKPLTITQQRSAWDSNSLRQNYISRQTDDYLAVQGQGLTIYMFGDQANWVNHGVWYKVAGTSKLSREQVLKIAYGL